MQIHVLLHAAATGSLQALLTLPMFCTTASALRLAVMLLLNASATNLATADSAAIWLAKCASHDSLTKPVGQCLRVGCVLVMGVG